MALLSDNARRLLVAAYESIKHKHHPFILERVARAHHLPEHLLQESTQELLSQGLMEIAPKLKKATLTPLGREEAEKLARRKKLFSKLRKLMPLPLVLVHITYIPLDLLALG